MYVKIENRFSSQNFFQKPNHRICFSILICSQDRKINLLVRFLEEVLAVKFAFEIYLPLYWNIGNLIYRKPFTIAKLCFSINLYTLWCLINRQVLIKGWINFFAYYMKNRVVTRAVHLPKPDSALNAPKTHRRCQILFCKTQVRPQSCWSYPLWRP